MIVLAAMMAAKAMQVGGGTPFGIGGEGRAIGGGGGNGCGGGCDGTVARSVAAVVVLAVAVTTAVVQGSGRGGERVRGSITSRLPPPTATGIGGGKVGG